MLGGPNRLVSHFDLEISQQIEIRKTLLSWSPVTESNRRPSPYHACRFRLMPSSWVGLSQVAGIAASERVALRLPLTEVVVTCLVTGSGIPSPRDLDPVDQSVSTIES